MTPIHGNTYRTSERDENFGPLFFAGRITLAAGCLTILLASCLSSAKTMTCRTTLQLNQVKDCQDLIIAEKQTPWLVIIAMAGAAFAMARWNRN